MWCVLFTFRVSEVLDKEDKLPDFKELSGDKRQSASGSSTPVEGGDVENGLPVSSQKALYRSKSGTFKIKKGSHNCPQFCVEKKSLRLLHVYFHYLSDTVCAKRSCINVCIFFAHDHLSFFYSCQKNRTGCMDGRSSWPASRPSSSNVPSTPRGSGRSSSHRWEHYQYTNSQALIFCIYY